MTRTQRFKYQTLREQGWRYSEEFPSCGIVIMEMQHGERFNFVTLYPDGSTKQGRQAPWIRETP